VDLANAAVRLAVFDDDAPVREVEVPTAQIGDLVGAEAGQAQCRDHRPARAPTAGRLSGQPDRCRLRSADPGRDALPRKPLDLAQMAHSPPELQRLGV